MVASCIGGHFEEHAPFKEHAPAYPHPAATPFFSAQAGQLVVGTELGEPLVSTLLEMLAAEAGPALRLAHLAAAPPQSSSL